MVLNQLQKDYFKNNENFISNFDNLFIKFEDRNKIEINNKQNYLYLFDVDCYGNQQLPPNTCKLGMTNKQIHSRLFSYGTNINMRNIECIHTEYPKEKERLIKAFIKHKLNLKPVAGAEYFENCKYIIKCLYIIFCRIPDIELIEYYNVYNSKNEGYINIFDDIYTKYYNNDILENNNDNIDTHQASSNTDEEYKNIEVIETNIKMTDKLVCEYCKKEYTTLSNLKYHQKHTVSCLNIQKEMKTEFKCEFCNKVFTANRYLSQHLKNYCKTNKTLNKNELLQKEIEELKKKLIEKDYALKSKDEMINKLEKNIDKLQKQIAERPTNIYNTNTNNTTHNNNNTTNYQIQFNQLFENIEKLTSENFCRKIDSIEITDITNPGIQDFENRVSNRLSHVFKDFTFCTDKSRKTVVIKGENEEMKKVPLNELIETGLNYGIQNIIEFIKQIEDFNDTKIDDYSKDEYAKYDDGLQLIKDYLLEQNKKKNPISVSHDKYPLPSLVKNTLNNCAHLTKG